MTTRIFFALLTWVLLVQAAGAQTVGRTPGQFNVSAAGSAQYSIPIWAPPGPHGLQPHLALTYDSRDGNGSLGVGWSLSGLSAITRCNLTYAQDAAPAAIGLLASDGYCMNGQRLRLTSGTYGAAGSTYQTEVANFVNVTAVGSAGNGPAYFIGQDRNAVKYYYGNSGSSQVLAPGTSTALSWQLNQVVDPAGNTMTISYNTATGNAVPATISWTPSSHGSSSYVYSMVFNYGVRVQQNTTQKYVAGSSLTNANLLASITISDSSVFKKYVLSYQASPTTGRDRLYSILECADSAGTNCLAPTRISYQNGQVGVSTAAATAPGSELRYDFNGDGLPDAVYFNGTSLYVALNTGHGFGTPINTGITTLPLFGDVLGSGTDGMLVANGATFYYYQYVAASNSFSGVNTGAVVTPGYGYTLTDITGDGLPDLVAIQTGGLTISTDPNTSFGGVPSFSPTVYSYTVTLSLPATVRHTGLITDSPAGQGMRAFDFNGDGRKDVVLSVTTLKSIGGGETVVNNFSYQLISNGANAAFSIVKMPFDPSLDPPNIFGNFNDDRCTDVALGSIVFFSGCNGTVATTLTLAGSPNIIASMDWNGDGRTDLLAGSPGGALTWYQSTGSGFASPQSSSFTIPSACSSEFFVLDEDADGLDDFGCVTSSGTFSYFVHNLPGQPADLLSQVIDGYGNSASPSYGSLSQGGGLYTNYTDATAGYVNYIGPRYVVSEAVFSDPSNPPGNTFNQQYSYYGAWMNLQGRGFTGFERVQRYDSRSALWENFFNDVKFPYVGILDAHYLSQDQARTKYIKTNWINRTYTLLDSTPNNQRYFAYINDTFTQLFEAGGTEDADLVSTSETTYAYDNYGNATNIVTTVADTDPGSPYNGNTWTTNTTNTTDISINSTADLGAWCLGLLDQTQVVYSSTLPGSTTVTRTKTFTPDTPAACRIVSSVTEPTANSGLYKATEAMTFDAFGNIHTDTVTGANMPASPASRMTTLNWGTTGQFLSSVTDPSGAVSTANYSSSLSLGFEVPDSVTNPNNLTTSWTYDAFGRKSKETRPDGTSTTWTWSTCTSFCGWSNSFYQIAQTNFQTNGSTAIRTDTNLYDPIDRVTESFGPTVTGTTEIVQNLYNSLGLKTQQSLPYISGGSVYQQTYSYDELNRLTAVTRPISSTNSNPQSTTYAYAGRKVVVSDPYAHSKTIINDVNGKLRQTTDALGYKITRAYDAANSLTGVTDSAGNTLLSGVTYKYGIKPFRVAATDADRGAWTYTIDSLGERTGWKDAKGQSFSMTYDSLSRPLTRTEPDLFSQWTYGSTPASHNVGQLISECSNTTGSCGSTPIYTETRTFDSDARLSTRSIKDSALAGNNTGGVFLFTYGYSATTGLPSSLTYPISTSSVALNLSYAFQNGLLQSVTDTTDTTTTCGTSCTLWAANSVNAFGEITKETLGNGVVAIHTYDAVTSWLSAATAGVGGGATLLNQSYAEDEDGNVTQRQNNNLGLTENFFYDADNRLLCATLASSCSTNTFAYDGGAAGPGNITSQTGVGTYTYPAAGQPRPHAVTGLTGTLNGIVNPSFAYDANGNMTNRASSTANVVWTSFNYPSSISGTDVTGTETVAINYGPDRQRVQQNYTGPSGVESTFYIGGLMDIVIQGSTTNYRHYVNAGSEPVAVYSRTAAGVNTMSYTLEDHQGSISTIASKSGSSDVNESFSAFGARRNPATWSGAPSTADLNTIASLSRQGYTFQTWLGQSMGLNHMNGRVEDAILGRFLSPDPHIPDPSNAQSYNRYSYVNNNPLSFTDPTGFDDVSFTAPTDDSGGILPDGYLDFTIDPPRTYTGSNIPGHVPNNWDCSGYCGVPNGSGTVGTTGADDTTGAGGTTTGGGAAAGNITTQAGGSAQSQSSTQGATPDDGTLNQIVVTSSRISLPDLQPLTFYNHFLDGSGTTVVLTSGQFYQVASRGNVIRTVPNKNGTYSQLVSYYGVYDDSGANLGLTFGSSTLTVDENGFPLGFSDVYDFDEHERSTAFAQFMTWVGARGYYMGGEDFRITYP